MVSDPVQCAAISASRLEGLLHMQNVTCCIQLKLYQSMLQPNGQSELCGVHQVDPASLPEDLQHMLTEFVDLFQAPTTLPPQRVHDHAIDLLLGALPVNIRPYKYSPAQKMRLRLRLLRCSTRGSLNLV